MTNALLRYDAANMMSSAVGRHGAKASELKSIAKRLEAARCDIIDDAKNGRRGWMLLPDDPNVVMRTRRLVDQKKAFTDCILVGIGGSELGARALAQALPAKGMRLHIAGSNTDPDQLSKILKSVDLRRTLINIVSKSGDTVEPMAAFFIIREPLERAVGKANVAKHIVATTDETSGSLRALAERDGYATLPVPANVGGRFSVLSDVGLFPLACTGVDTARILRGAKRERDAFLRNSILESGPALLAALNYLAYTKRGQRIQILMPYADALRETGAWYRQLWAESLGKRVDRKGRAVHLGPTPVAALGASDQHSQIQLYNEGPNDKTITFIRVEKFASNLRVPKAAKQIEALSWVAGMPLAKINHAEQRATAEALAANGRPNGVIQLPAMTPESMGALIMFMEIATVISASLYDVNAYDQPGVEQGKRLIPKFL